MHSALLIATPEAEALVGPFRVRHDPSAGLGIPAHVTVLYPFVAPPVIDRTLRDRLAGLFATIGSFRFACARTDRFPGALYLVPEPAETFRRLTRAVWDLWPDYPPYGGAYSEITPHLTIAQSDDPGTLDAVESEFADAAAAMLPIAGVANEVVLMVQDEAGYWHRDSAFPLAGGA